MRFAFDSAGYWKYARRILIRIRTACKSKGRGKLVTMVSALTGDVSPRVLGQECWRVPEEQFMVMVSRRTVSIYVDRSSQQWIVRDPEGNFWIVPADDHPWDHRQPFQLTDKIKLDPVPGHYKDLLGLPF